MKKTIIAVSILAVGCSTEKSWSPGEIADVGCRAVQQAGPFRCEYSAWNEEITITGHPLNTSSTDGEGCRAFAQTLRDVAKSKGESMKGWRIYVNGYGCDI